MDEADLTGKGQDAGGADAAGDVAATAGAESDNAAPRRAGGAGQQPAATGSTRLNQAQAVKPTAAGRGLGLFSLLLATGAAGLAGYLYYQLIFLTPMIAVDARLGGVESQAAQIAAELATLTSQQAASLADFSRSQKAELELAQERMITAFNEVAKQAPPSRREWMVAEVAYLLRIANHRLLMERDVEAALQLLTVADTILLELDDFGLYQVRAELADEILALSNVESNDVQGIYLQLEAIKSDLAHLPVKLPEYLLQNTSPAPAATDGFWQALFEQFSSYLRFRRFDGSTKPLLAPEEAVYLELNLRLMLERAQLAALRREQIVYEQSLTTAADWLDEYLDTNEASVRRAIAELSDLARINLDQELPDISGSLTTLQSARREGS